VRERVRKRERTREVGQRKKGQRRKEERERERGKTFSVSLFLKRAQFRIWCSLYREGSIEDGQEPPGEREREEQSATTPRRETLFSRARSMFDVFLFFFDARQIQCTPKLSPRPRSARARPPSSSASTTTWRREGGDEGVRRRRASPKATRPSNVCSSENARAREKESEKESLFFLSSPSRPLLSLNLDSLRSLNLHFVS
jgi:hypothetical protein